MKRLLLILALLAACGEPEARTEKVYIDAPRQCEQAEPCDDCGDCGSCPATAPVDAAPVCEVEDVHDYQDWCLTTDSNPLIPTLSNTRCEQEYYRDFRDVPVVMFAWCCVRNPSGQMVKYSEIWEGSGPLHDGPSILFSTEETAPECNGACDG